MPNECRCQATFPSKTFPGIDSLILRPLHILGATNCWMGIFCLFVLNKASSGRQFKGKGQALGPAWVNDREDLPASVTRSNVKADPAGFIEPGIKWKRSGFSGAINGCYGLLR